MTANPLDPLQLPLLGGETLFAPVVSENENTTCIRINYFNTLLPPRFLGAAVDGETKAK